MIEFLSQPWPWYAGGVLLGLMVPVLLVLIHEHFGVSSSFRHIRAATLPLRSEYFRYDWRGASWNIFLVIGVVIGAFLAATVLDGTDAPRGTRSWASRSSIPARWSRPQDSSPAVCSFRTSSYRCCSDKEGNRE